MSNIPPPSTPTGGTAIGLAIASLVLGILGFAQVPLSSLLAIVLGHVAERRAHGAVRGLAIAGAVLGWVAAGLAVLRAFA